MAFLLEVAEHLKSVSSPELKSPQLPVTDVINTLLKNKDFKVSCTVNALKTRCQFQFRSIFRTIF